MRFTDLPRDLESEILSRVPAKSLQKLKPTCKRWYALFRDPKFLEKHVAKASREFLALLDSKFQTISVNLGNSSVDPSIELTGTLNIQKDPKDVIISEVSQCDGILVCITNDKRLVAWNPYTGQTRWIPYKHKLHHKCLLGYENNNDKSCDSFKILSYFHCYEYIADDELEIYEFKSDSWRSLDDLGIGPNASSENDGVTLKGNVYWFAADFKDPVDHFILRFDFTTEKFGRLSIPFEKGHFDGCVEPVVLSVVREDKLALLYLDFNSVEMMKIWVTKTDEAKDLSWSSFLVVDLSQFMVTVATNVFSFLVDEEKKMVMFCDGAHVTKVYIVGEEVYKEVFEKTQTVKASYPRLVSYAPSLVQIQQGKVNPGGKRKR